MIVRLTLPLKLIGDVTRLWRNFAPPGNFLRTPLDKRHQSGLGLPPIVFKKIRRIVCDPVNRRVVV